MAYSVHCTCGRSHEVSAGDAGSLRECSCGRTVRVPSLGKLAQAAGEARKPLSPAETIRMLVAAGELPQGASCVRCQFPTRDVLECERPYAKSRGFWQTVGIYVFLPLQAAAILSREQPEVLGREVVVKTPLRMCLDCQPLFDSGRRLSELRRLLSSVPQYDALLQQYPSAGIMALPRVTRT